MSGWNRPEDELDKAFALNPEPNKYLIEQWYKTALPYQLIIKSISSEKAKQQMLLEKD